jgi:hypothetical protein
VAAADKAKITEDRERAERALDLVRLDVIATLPDVVNLRIESSEGGSHWVTDDHGSSFGEFVETEDGEAPLLASVADNAQTVVFDVAGRAWPECSVHDGVLYATIKSDTAVWECRTGHVVAAIGRLGANHSKASPRSELSSLGRRHLEGPDLYPSP